MELETIFNDVYAGLNRDRFNNTLPILPIKITTGKKYIASCCTKNGELSHINVSVDNLQVAGEEEITAILLHEMVHAYCIVNHIPHYDMNAGRHLPGFIDAAAEHGLFYDDDFNINFIF